MISREADNYDFFCHATFATFRFLIGFISEFLGEMFKPHLVCKKSVSLLCLLLAFGLALSKACSLDHGHSSVKEFV